MKTKAKTFSGKEKYERSARNLAEYYEIDFSQDYYALTWWQLEALSKRMDFDNYQYRGHDFCGNSLCAYYAKLQKTKSKAIIHGSESLGECTIVKYNIKDDTFIVNHNGTICTAIYHEYYYKTFVDTLDAIYEIIQ